MTPADRAALAARWHEARDAYARAFCGCSGYDDERVRQMNGAATGLALVGDALLAAALTAPPNREAPDFDERIVEDDEIVCQGDFHMERMDDGHIWFAVTVRGERRAFDLLARGRISWSDQDGWQPFARLAAPKGAP